MEKILTKKAHVIWFTGLSGAGKTTLSQKVSDVLSSKKYAVKILDGDIVRRELHRHLGFTPEDIQENIRLLSELCLKFAGDCDFILVAAISPFRQARLKAREKIGSGFMEVYVKASLEEVIRRDTKGLYKKALNGEIKNFIGIDPIVPYEAPLDPEVIIDTEHESISDSVHVIIKKVLER